MHERIYRHMACGGNFQVTVALLALVAATLLTSLASAKQEHAKRVEDVSVYWHFVGVVWVIVLIVVYIAGR